MSDYFFTSEDLIESIKRRASVPSNTSLMNDTEILAFADEEIRMNIVPMLMSTNEAFYLHREEIPLITGKSNYDMPYRAIASKLREVGYDNNGYRPLHRVSIDYLNHSPSDTVNYFYLQGDQLILHSNISENGSKLVIFYPIRPNRLVKGNEVGIISEIDRDAGIVRFSDIKNRKRPTSEIWGDDLEYDFIKTKSNHGILDFDKKAIGITAALNGNINSLTFDPADIPSGLKVGDRVALSGKTDIVSCPTDIQPMLAQSVATRILEAIGDIQNLDAANDKLARMNQSAYTLTENRVEGSPIKIVRRNGLLRNSRRQRFIRGY